MPNLNLVFNTFWFSQYPWYKNVMAILKFQFACNYSINLNFDMQYLGSTRSDLHDVFCYLFAIWSIFRLYQNWNWCPLPSSLNPLKKVGGVVTVRPWTLNGIFQKWTFWNLKIYLLLQILKPLKLGSYVLWV